MKTIEVVVIMHCADHVTPREVSDTVEAMLECEGLDPYMSLSSVHVVLNSTDTDGVSNAH